MITKEELRILRNEVPINLIIADVLDIPWKVSEGYFRFLCPFCSEFNSSTNPKTNLARCFTCKTNFNPIDMTMAVKKYRFIDAVDFVRNIRGALINKN
jgi:DNA primase